MSLSETRRINFAGLWHTKKLSSHERPTARYTKRYCFNGISVQMVSLAVSGILGHAQKADQLVAVHAHRAHVMYWLTIGTILSEPIDHVILICRHKFISGLLLFKGILRPNLPRQIHQGFAKLQVGYICRGQVSCKIIKQFRGAFTCFIFVFGEKLLRRIRSFYGSSRQTHCGLRHAEHCTYCFKVHCKNLVPENINRAPAIRNYAVNKVKRHKSPGVVSDFGASEGTGGGTAAQDRPNINFSTCENAA